MRFFPFCKRNFYKHLIYANWIVSFSAGILTYGNCVFFEIPNPFWYALFSMTSTWLVYNFQRMYKSKHYETNERLQWVQNNFRGLLYSSALFLFINALSYIWFGGIKNWSALAFLLGCALVSFFYVVKIKHINLREIPLMKIHWVAQSWVLILILFPWLNEGVWVENGVFFLIAIYFYVFAVTIPFDIRDVKYDQKYQKTLPITLGILTSKIIAGTMLGISAFILYHFFNKLNFEWILLAITVQAVLIFNAKPQRSDLYFNGWIDGGISILGLSFLM